MLYGATWLNKYTFLASDGAANWVPLGGRDMFCGVNVQNCWVPHYIGQAESLAVRLPTHERWKEAEMLGATHVHTMVVPERDKRDAIEHELIGQYQPLLNVHHR